MSFPLKSSTPSHGTTPVGPTTISPPSNGLVNRQPQSFVRIRPKSQSRHGAGRSAKQKQRSPLAGILTSRHFCLLAPRDDDPHHAAFVDQENRRRDPLEAASPVSRDDLDRFSAALGFCDLLSLCLCSGLAGSVQVPLSHPADPASRHAAKVTIVPRGETVRLDPQIIAPGTLIHVDGWIALSPNVLASQRFYWTIA